MPKNIKIITSRPQCFHNPELIGNGKCDRQLVNTHCDFDGGDCCRDDWIGNKFCDFVNNFENCGNFDGGDCELKSTESNTTTIGKKHALKKYDQILPQLCNITKFLLQK